MSWDIRRDMPYGAYPEFTSMCRSGTGSWARSGDCWDRFSVRVLEMVESSKIIRQALDKLPEGEIHGQGARAS